MEKKQIGVLAVQGAFAEHIAWYGDWAQRRLRSGSFRIWSGRWTD